MENPSRRDERRRLPSVDALLRSSEAVAWVASWGREPVVAALRASLEAARGAASVGGPAASVPALLAEAERRLEREGTPELRPVLNGTGVVLHTNLGRSPLPPEALEAVRRVARGYCNLEYELTPGRRGDRYRHCLDLLCDLTRAESALVVNNNAAAVALVINELARGRDVIVSRGELVEIGGSFRMPDVVESAGGFLVEVGTTNRTRLEDYRRALGPSTGVLLKVHPSNYRISGFVEETTLEKLVELGREADVPVVHDLGSGLLLPLSVPDLPAEPGPAESTLAGAEVTTWSGDKLLGGPQAGVIHGARRTIERLRRNPLLRAFRVDKMTLAALEATLRLHRDPELASQRVPALRMLRETAADVEARARVARSAVPEALREHIVIRPMRSLVGGGAFPGLDIESAGWAVRSPGATALDDTCRGLEPPLVGRVEEGEYLVDFRTIQPGEELEVARLVTLALMEQLAGSPVSEPP